MLNRRPSLWCIYAFTLFELLLTLSLASILMLLSAQGWYRWHARRKECAVIQQLIDNLQFAQETAVLKQATVTVCPLGKAPLCGEDWSKGLLLYISQEQSLKTIAFDLKPQQLQWHGWLQYSKIQFSADGSPHGYQGCFIWHNGSQKTVILTMNRLGHLTREII